MKHGAATHTHPNLFRARDGMVSSIRAGKRVASAKETSRAKSSYRLRSRINSSPAVHFQTSLCAVLPFILPSTR